MCGFTRMSELAEEFNFKGIMMIHRIGWDWEEHGGIFAGVARSYSELPDMGVILCKADTRRDMPWEHAMQWAAELRAEDFGDWILPTHQIAALLYANLKDHFDDKWYWCSDAYPQDVTCRWVQTFGYGRQADARMTDGCRARAIRLITL